MSVIIIEIIDEKAGQIYDLFRNYKRAFTGDFK